ncbi:aminopeptidase N [Filimonas sp.]|nr:aminopeptidase N [Filimonas sp.]
MLFNRGSLFAASALRSDTIDIRKTTIDLTITDFSSHVISAKTTLDIRSKLNNVNTVLFDLQGLTVDSVKVNGTLNTYTYLSPTLSIPLTTLLNLNDTALINVYYHGQPVTDPTWGGFSFSGNYGFQIGVGFNAQPHSFGRTWHPCFDNFVERCAYEFFITTEDTKAGICNGLLIDSSTHANNTKTWHWKLDEEIPSYLACLAVSNYVFVNKTLNGNAGNIPAMITCEAIDSNAVNGSFAHLQDAFGMLEQHFGTYSWPRIGYSLVPFNAGAMEHATNISIGKAFIDGSLTYETLIAHELSHHWWGDLVTCSTAGDMWLNEGFASYCEPLHLETVYGHDEYLAEIRGNHYEVLRKAHITDNGYRSIANMDSLYTYGATVYSKAEDAIHSLRSYMGDTLFFGTLQSFLNAHKFQSVNTIQLRDYLTANSGIDLTDYFKNWILAPGFTHFSIDSSKANANGGNFDVNVFIRQRKHHSTDYYDHVPLELAFYDAQMNPFIYTLEFSGRCMQFNVTLPFNPVMIVIDPASKISDAITEEQQIIKSIGNITFAQAKLRMVAKGIVSASDSTLFRAEHNWVAPDRFKSAASFPGYVLCNSRYWKIDGIHLSNLQGLLQFNYDAGTNNNFLDSAWLKNTEDSIRLFYRKDATEEWQFANDSLSAGSLVDKKETSMPGKSRRVNIPSGSNAAALSILYKPMPLQADVAS